MDFKALWTTFRKTRWFRLVYLTLASALGALMLPTALGCFSIVLIPLVILAVPHSLGERSFRRHAANGVFCMVMISIFYAAIVTPSVMSLPQEPLGASASGTVIRNGLVAPFRGGAYQEFTFTVNVSSNDTRAENFTVELYLAEPVGFGGDQFVFAMGGNVSNISNGGEDFTYTLPLRPLAHLYGFQVTWINGTTPSTIVQTAVSVGPFNAPYEAYFGFLWARAILFLTFVAFFFYLILMLYWWTRKAKDIRGKPAPEPAKRAEGGGEFTCTNCGADVSEADAKCPNCGASFDAGPGHEPADAKP